MYVSIISSKQQPPIFKQARHTFFVQEDAAPQSVVGTVTASSRDPSKYIYVTYLFHLFFLCHDKLC